MTGPRSSTPSVVPGSSSSDDSEDSPFLPPSRSESSRDDEAAASPASFGVLERLPRVLDGVFLLPACDKSVTSRGSEAAKTPASPSRPSLILPLLLPLLVPRTTLRLSHEGHRGVEEAPVHLRVPAPHVPPPLHDERDEESQDERDDGPPMLEARGTPCRKSRRSAPCARRGRRGR